MKAITRRRSAPASGPRRKEHAEAVQLMRMVRLHEARYPEMRLLYAIPNGGHRNKATAAKMKAEGVRAGVPDYCLPVARDTFHGLYIELKTATGYPSREQRQWVSDLRAEGYRVEVCRGWEAAWFVLREYLDLPHATRAIRAGGVA